MNRLNEFAFVIANISNKQVKITNAIDAIKNDESILSFGHFWGKFNDIESNADFANCADSINDANNAESGTSLLKNKNTFIFHPLNLDANNLFNYEISTECGVAWLLLYFLVGDKLQNELSQIDLGYLSSESNLAEEDLECLDSLKDKPFSLILGYELAFHTQVREIAFLLGQLAKHTNASVYLNPLDSSFSAIITPQLASQDIFPPYPTLMECNGNMIYILPCESRANKLFVPKLFASKCKLDSNLNITLSIESKKIKAKTHIDSTLKGTIGILYLPLKECVEFEYPYKQVEVTL